MLLLEEVDHEAIVSAASAAASSAHCESPCEEGAGIASPPSPPPPPASAAPAVLSPYVLSPIIARHAALRCQLNICFNEVGQSDYNRSVRLSKVSPLSELRQSIAKTLNRDPQSFKIRRSATGPELKDDSITLDAASLVDGSSVYIEPGTPLKPSEFLIRFCLHDSKNAKMPFRALGSLVLAKNIRISEVKSLLLAYLEANHSDGHGSNTFGLVHIRLRERTGLKVGRIFLDAQTLHQNLGHSLADNVEVAVQALSHPEVVGPQDMPLIIQRLRPQTKVLDHPEEIIIRKMSRVAELKTLLSTHSSIPAERIALAKGTAMFKVCCFSLLERCF